MFRKSCQRVHQFKSLTRNSILIQHNHLSIISTQFSKFPIRSIHENGKNIDVVNPKKSLKETYKEMFESNLNTQYKGKLSTNQKLDFYKHKQQLIDKLLDIIYRKDKHESLQKTINQAMRESYELEIYADRFIEYNNKVAENWFKKICDEITETDSWNYHLQGYVGIPLQSGRTLSYAEIPLCEGPASGYNTDYAIPISIDYDDLVRTITNKARNDKKFTKHIKKENHLLNDCTIELRTVPDTSKIVLRISLDKGEI